jgi:hypothetical protein
MTTVGGINMAVASLQRGIEHYENTAKRLTSTIDPGRLAENIVALDKSVTEVKVQAAVVRSHNEIMGTLLDIFG